MTAAAMATKWNMIPATPGWGGPIEQANSGALRALVRMLDARDTETEAHSRRVVQISLTLGMALGLAPAELRAIEVGAMLHDVGKIGVPDSILRKPAPLSTDEWHVMRQHPELGHDILSELGFLKSALPLVLHHHERWAGDGYPHRLRGNDIPLGARIFAVADAYDVIRSRRPYKPPYSHPVAVDIIRRDTGTHFDPRVSQAFFDLYAQRPPRLH